MTEDRSEAAPHPTVAELRKAEEAYGRALQRLATTRCARDKARRAHRESLMDAARGSDPHARLAERYSVVEGTVRKYRVTLGWAGFRRNQDDSDDQVG